MKPPFAPAIYTDLFFDVVYRYLVMKTAPTNVTVRRHTFHWPGGGADATLIHAPHDGDGECDFCKDDLCLAYIDAEAVDMDWLYNWAGVEQPKVPHTARLTYFNCSTAARTWTTFALACRASRSAAQSRRSIWPR